MLALVLMLSLLQQHATAGAKNGSTHRSVPATRPPAAAAVRAVRPPALDGRDADEVWRNATPIQAFQEFEPNEGKAPRFATEAKVAYDARNIYVFVRAYDPEPAKIRRLLARRDIRTR